VKVRYLRRALQHIADIHAYIAAENRRAADTVVERLVNRIRLLEETPRQGRLGVRPGTREIVVAGTPYIVTYRIVQDAIEILTIRDGRRKTDPD
jgi:toxin ParE1/3/4